MRRECSEINQVFFNTSIIWVAEAYKIIGICSERALRYQTAINHHNSEKLK